MNISFNITDPAIQNKILEVILGNKGSQLYDFSSPEFFKNLPDKLGAMLSFLASGSKTQDELKKEFGENYFTYLSHITRRVNGILKHAKSPEKYWYEYSLQDKYQISSDACAAIQENIAVIPMPVLDPEDLQ